MHAVPVGAPNANSGPDLLPAAVGAFGAFGAVAHESALGAMTLEQETALATFQRDLAV